MAIKKTMAKKKASSAQRVKALTARRETAGWKGKTMTVTVVEAKIRKGYTGLDHLIDGIDEQVAGSFVGREFAPLAKAQHAVASAFMESADKRVHTARIDVTVRGANGRFAGPNAAYFTRLDKARDFAKKKKRCKHGVCVFRALWRRNGLTVITMD